MKVFKLILKILYLVIAAVCFGWTLILSLMVGNWLFYLYLIFGIAVAVIGILALIKKKKLFRILLYSLCGVPVLAAIIMIICSVAAVVYMWFVSMFALLFSH